MNAWSLQSQKGGSGKTTIALNLAAAALKAGKSVLVADMDPQRSALKFGRIRGAGPLRVTACLAVDLPKLLLKAGADGIDLVIADTASRADKDFIDISRNVDLVIIPSRASVFDIASSLETADLLRKASLVPHVFVLNGTSLATPEGKEAAKILSDAGQLLPAALGERADFRRALTEGKGVTEFAPASKAAGEVLALYSALEALSRTRQHRKGR